MEEAAQREQREQQEAMIILKLRLGPKFRERLKAKAQAARLTLRRKAAMETQSWRRWRLRRPGSGG